jgi:hypothetical protein
MLKLHQESAFHEVFLNANTPLYLLKRLRRLPALSALSDGASVVDLKNEYARRVEKDVLTLNDAAVALACLVAIAVKATPEAETALGELETGRLEWAAEIRELHRETTPRVAIAVVRVVEPPLPRVRSSAHSATDSTERIQMKPTLSGRASL